MVHYFFNKRKESPSHMIFPTAPRPSSSASLLPPAASQSHHTKIKNRRKVFSITFVVLLSFIAITFYMIAVVLYTMSTIKTEIITIPTSANIVLITSRLLAKSDAKKRSTRTFPPRVVQLGSTKRDRPFSYHYTPKSSPPSYLLTYYNSSVNQTYRVPYIQGNCTPIASWQIDSKPNCNSMHEIDIPNFVMSSLKIRRLREGSIAFLGQGWFRMAWKLHTGLATAIPKPKRKKESNNPYQDYIETHFQNFLSPAVILKSLRFERDFSDENYDFHRRDAMAMERLTFSPFVLNVYGYCGHSALNELAVDNVEKVFKVGNRYDSNTEFKLQTCLALAKAVAHVHTFDKPLPSTLVHYDLNPSNVAIMADGTPKLNDFNIAEFLRWDNTTKKPCGFTGRFYEPWWRAQEEMKTPNSEIALTNHLVYDPNAATLTEKVDVFSLGNVMYQILTGRAPRRYKGRYIPENEPGVRQDLVNGILPPLLSNYSKSSDPYVMSIVKAIHMCYQTDPSLRSTAQQVADFLSDSMNGIKGSSVSQPFL